MEYKTIAARCEARFVEKKSEFIGYLAPVSTEEEAVAFVNEIRAMHRKATHNCYAYILRDNNISRHSDDGEPSGTAGVPMYEVLKKEGLTDVACVVTRYFGGILLGAGGLVRAYTNGVKIAVEAAKIKLMCSAARLKLTMDYTYYGKIAATLAEFDTRTENEDFSDNVAVIVIIREERAEAFKAQLVDLCNGRIEIAALGTLEYDFN